MGRADVRCWLVVLAVLLQGCASTQSALKPAADGSPAAPAGNPAGSAGDLRGQVCSEATRLPASLVEPGSVVLFGEGVHGTQELPQFFGEAVCSVADSRLPVHVGLEIEKGEQAAFEAFLASPGAPSDVAALMAAPHWSRKFQDGKSSRAMVALLERMRQLRAQGLPIDLFLFDLDPTQTAVERDKTMAENIASQVRSHPEALTMALTGDLHAFKVSGSPWDPDFRAMGWHLVQDGVNVHSLGTANPAGTAWVCRPPQGESAMDCAARPIKAGPALPSGRATGIELLPEPSTEGFDGLYAPSSLTASLPAISDSDH